MIRTKPDLKVLKELERDLCQQLLGQPTETSQNTQFQPDSEQKDFVFLTPKEFAERMGVSVMTVYAWVHTEKIRSVRVSSRRGCIRIPLGELERLWRS